MRIQNLHRCIWGRTGGGAGFIVDFYCHKAGLMIELDGSVHDGQIEADAQRDKVLKEMGGGGLSVSRITRPREFIHCVGENQRTSSQII